MESEWDEAQKVFNDEGSLPELEPDSTTPDLSVILEDGPSIRKENRLIELRKILRRRLEREKDMKETAIRDSSNEGYGLKIIENDSSETSEPATPERKLRKENLMNHTSQNTDFSEGAGQLIPQNSLSDNELENSSQSSELIASPSMSLLDASANHLFSLMKGLHADQPDVKVKTYDPDRVNAACNCAKQIYSIMRLKLDAIKVQKKIK